MPMNIADICVAAHALSLEKENKIHAPEAGFMITDACVQAGLH
jgi:hypothetical protein